jgi:hypothetical protein
MIADKAQDKTIQFLSDHSSVTNTTNAANQDITFSGGSGSMTVAMPSSQNNGTVGLGSTLSLAAGQVAYFTADRNASFSVADLSALTVANIEDVPVDENIFIFAFRLAGADVWLWDGTHVSVGTLISFAALREIVQENKTVKLVKGGTWNWDLGTTTLSWSWSSSAFIQVASVTEVSNEISAGSVSLTADGQVAYVSINRVSGAATISVSTAAIDVVADDDDIFIIARRVGSDVLVGTSSFLLKDGEYLELDGALAEINRLLGQLKLTEHESDNFKVRVGDSISSLLDGRTLVQELNEFVVSFSGAVINFSTGAILESDDATPLGLNFTPFSVPVGQYFWYGISLIPAAIDATNRQEVQVQVTPASAANATQNLAPLPVIAGDKKLGAVQVYNNAGNIEIADIWRLGTGAGSGGGAGDTFELLERMKNHLDVIDFLAMTPNVFQDNKEDLIDTATASFSAANKVYEFTAGGQNIVSVQMSDDQFRTESKDISKIDLSAYWELLNLDPGATYEVSRDGGNEYQTVTMERTDGTDSFQGSMEFVDEATFATTVEHDVVNEDTDLAFTDAGADQAWAQAFTLSDATVIKQITSYFSTLGTIAGNVCVQIIADNSGTPSTDPADILYQSNPQSVALAAGDHNIVVTGTTVLPAGTYHLVYETDQEYKDSFSVGVDELRVRADSTAPAVPTASTYNGTAWSTSGGGEGIVYLLEGRVIDLRVRVTSSIANVELKGYAISYDAQLTTESTQARFEQDFKELNGDDNTTSVTIGFEGDNKFLLVFDDTGQVYRPGTHFVVSGNVVEFNDEYFDKPGETIKLEFMQYFEGSLQFDAINRQILMANGLGHPTVPALDFSSPGLGPIVESEDGIKGRIKVAAGGVIIFEPL